MVEKGLLTAEEARGALEDAAAAHLRQETPGPVRHHQELAAQFIERLAMQVDAAGQVDGGQVDGGHINGGHINRD